MSINEMRFIKLFEHFSQKVLATATEKGWEKDRDDLVKVAGRHSKRLGQFAANAVGAMQIALCHSELSEALEGLRAGDAPDDKIPKFTMEEAEYADTIIRIMNRSAKKQLRVAQAIIVKMHFNDRREPMHGGKKM